MIVRAWVFLAGQLVYALAVILACFAVSDLFLRVFWSDTPVPMDGFGFVLLALLGPGWVGHVLVLLYLLFRWSISTKVWFLALQLFAAIATAGLMGILFLVGERIAVDSLVWTLAPYAILPAIATAGVYKLLGRRHLAPRRAERATAA